MRCPRIEPTIYGLWGMNSAITAAEASYKTDVLFQSDSTVRGFLTWVKKIKNGLCPQHFLPCAQTNKILFLQCMTRQPIVECFAKKCFISGSSPQGNGYWSLTNQWGKRRVLHILVEANLRLDNWINIATRVFFFSSEFLRACDIPFWRENSSSETKTFLH